MLTLISPAKKLLNSLKPYPGTMTKPPFQSKTLELIQLMKSKSVDDIAQLMDLSQELSELNWKRFQTISLGKNTSYPAVFLFQGDVYQGLKASQWSLETLEFAKNHLGILSGLYGYLNIMDGIEPYRLEMGTKLNNSCGTNLYDFWRSAITEWVNQLLENQKNPVLINLASQEYFSVIDNKKLKYPIVTINFYEKKDNALKMVGILAKKARGTLAKYMMEHQIDDIAGIKDFKELGYCFQMATSTDLRIDFVRQS